MSQVPLQNPTMPKHNTAGLPPGMQGLPSQMPPGMGQAPQQSPEVQALLAELHDVQAPAAVGIWPPAPGWIVIFILTSVAIIFAVRRIVQHHLANRYRRAALKALEQLEREANNSDEQFAHALFALLKRTAFSAYPHSRKHLARLHSDAWLRFLDTTQKSHYFASPLGNILLAALYENGSIGTTDKAKCFAFSRKWIKQHKTLNATHLQALLASDAAKAVTATALPTNQKQTLPEVTHATA